MTTSTVLPEVSPRISDVASARELTPAQRPMPKPDMNLFDFVKKLAADLSGGDLELPGFPDVVLRLHRTLGDDKSSSRDIVRLISSEPALGARLIQLANSAAFNPGDRAVSDLKSAVTILGFNLVRSTATSFAVRQLEQQEWLKPLRGHLALVWKDSVAVAATCFTAARHVEGVQPDEALATGLFHQLGSLYVLTRAHREGIAVGSETEWANSISDWHPTIARAIVENWGMSAMLAEAVESQDFLLGDEAAAVATLSPLARLLAASKLWRSSEGGQKNPASLKAMELVRIGNRSFVEVVTAASDEIEKVSQAIAR